MGQFRAYRRAVDAGGSPQSAMSEALGSAPVGVVLGGEMRRRAEVASEGTGLPLPDMLRVGLHRVVMEFETLGRITVVATSGFSREGGAA